MRLDIKLREIETDLEAHLSQAISC